MKPDFDLCVILPATAKWTEEVPTSLDSCPDPTPRGTPLVREVRVPRFTPLILPCFIASKMLLLCQQIIVSCAACTRPLNFLLLYIHFGHLNFPSHCLLSAGQNCEEASAMLSSPSPVSLPFQEVKANKGQEARSQVPDPPRPAGSAWRECLQTTGPRLEQSAEAELRAFRREQGGRKFPHHCLVELGITSWLESLGNCVSFIVCVSPDCELPRTDIIIALIATIYSALTMCHALF